MFLGKQHVEYKLSEIASIIMPQSDTEGYKGSGQAIVLAKNGKRFTLEKAHVGLFQASPGQLSYFYEDPVTGRVKHASLVIHKTLAEIRSGTTTGRLRYNPITKEFFPTTYNYDPYTGVKLEWRDP